MQKTIVCILFFLPYLSYASSSELESLDLDSLLASDVQITSVMKRTKEASKTAASVYVISNEQIVNSGVTSVAQALTLAPGMQVRKIDNNKWAIGIRNSSGRYTSRLLVMIDGQSIYNPSFAGVYWEALNIPVYDIERIEIIRGQGGLLWGTNATNGVVNVITKISNDTRSVKATVRTGTNMDYDASVRVGGDLNIGENSSYRAYINSQRTDKSDKAEKWTARDYGEKDSIGARFDVSFNADTSLLVQGDYTEIEMGQTLELANPGTFEGAEFATPQFRKHSLLMARLENRLSDSANQMLQISYAKQKGQQPYYTENFENIDVDYQVNILLEKTQLDVGLNYRHNKTPFVGSEYISSQHNVEHVTHYGLFAQANIPLITDELDLILGIKSEHNSLSHWEQQPSIRLAWQASDTNFLWTSVSQGVRVPSLLEFDYDTQVNGFEVGSIFNSGIGIIDETRIQTFVHSSREIEAEHILSTEFGHRYHQDTWQTDLSLFYSKSENALAIDIVVDPTVAPTILSLIQARDIDGFLAYTQSQQIDFNFHTNSKYRTYGGEFVTNWQTTPESNLMLGLSFVNQRHYQTDNNLLNLSGVTKQVFLAYTANITTNHNVMFQSRWEDGEIYKTDNFTVVDISWNWHVTPNLSLSLTGNNLLEKSHLEYDRTNELFDISTFIERSFSLGISVEL
ncbi:TonB-dependent receptor plug domain-containing protein [Thalassotalea sp. PLHSN55]|uniref:TonB-dependent receptor plug domain-containing protein n=1 Tax=Thalassotalea sp. PLHSN55 TaxID=3435888 RepID=UPI003F874D7D